MWSITTRALAFQVAVPVQAVEDQLPMTGLVAGPNVIAVEIHQNLGTSSDLSFDMELIARP